MRAPWSLTTAAHGGIDTTMGISDNHDAAVTAALAAAQDAIDEAHASAGPTARYELRADAKLVAIIQTGVDEDGSPDHVATRALVQRIEIERYLSAPPYSEVQAAEDPQE